MKIAILTGVSKSYAVMGEIAHRNKQRYCDEYGYDYIVDDEIYPDKHYDAIKGKSPNWKKVLLVLKYLPHYDYVMWSDCDTLIMNDKIKVEEFLVPEMSMCLSRYNSIENTRAIPHTGNFIIANNEASFNILNDIYYNPSYWCHNNTDICEEGAIFDYIQNKCKYYQTIKLLRPSALMSWLPIPAINSGFLLSSSNKIVYSDHNKNEFNFMYMKKGLSYVYSYCWPLYQKGDYIVHISSPASLQERESFMQYIDLNMELFK